MSTKLRQGDVMLIPTKKVSGATERSKTVALGEHSGHHHIVVGDARVVEKNGRMYVETGNDKAFLAHLVEGSMTKADHEPVELAPNTSYEVRIQNQYNPLSKLMEQVID